MFTDYFQMTDQPFCERIKTEHILTDERMSQGLARLSFLIHQGTIGLVTGQTGVGKSTLIRLFLSTVSPGNYHPVYIHFTHLKASSLLNLIASAFGASSTNTKDRRFMRIMNAVKKLQCTPILIIDEAHLLTSESITDLRLLVSSATDDVSPMKIILCGQDDLKHTIRRTDCTDFAQRVCVACQLKPLSREQTVLYISSQIKQAGCQSDVFDREAMSMIHDYTNGIPRQINNIATACLIHAAGIKSQKITVEVLTQAMAEINLF